MRGTAAREGHAMTSAARPICPGCGALRTNAEARYCEYCGAAYPLPSPPAAPAPVVVVAREPLGIPSALRALRTSGAAERLLAQAPASAHARVDAAGTAWHHSTFVQIAFVVIALALAGKCIASLATSDGVVLRTPQGVEIGAGGGIAMFVPWIVLGIVLYLIARSAVGRAQGIGSGTQLTSALAGVSDKRSEVSSLGHTTSTRYFATLEFEDGARRELAVASDLYATLRSGDVGAAWWSAQASDELAAFERASPAVEVLADAAR